MLISIYAPWVQKDIFAPIEAQHNPTNYIQLGYVCVLNFMQQTFKYLSCLNKHTVMMVLLSTHNICFGSEIRKIIFKFTLSSGGQAPSPCSTQLSTEFILLINVRMQTIVGILTFISMINTTSERLKAINFFICQNFSFYELKFHAQLSWAWKKLYNLWDRFGLFWMQYGLWPTCRCAFIRA